MAFAKLMERLVGKSAKERGVDGFLGLGEAN
jgi:hypothetical protein